MNHHKNKNVFFMSLKFLLSLTIIGIFPSNIVFAGQVCVNDMLVYTITDENEVTVQSLMMNPNIEWPDRTGNILFGFNYSSIQSQPDRVLLPIGLDSFHNLKHITKKNHHTKGYDEIYICPDLFDPVICNALTGIGNDFFCMTPNITTITFMAKAPPLCSKS